MNWSKRSVRDAVIILLSVVTRNWRNLLLILADLPFALFGGVLAFESSANRQITGRQRVAYKNGSMFFLRNASRKRASRTWYGATTKQEMRLKEKGKNLGAFFARYPSAILHRAVDVLQMFIGVLKGYAGLPINAPIGSIPKPSQIYHPC